MDWYDQFISEYREECISRGHTIEECDKDCESCWLFQDDLLDSIGRNDRIDPRDYLDQEPYEEACAFANEADEILSDEDIIWWDGYEGYTGGIRSFSVDPSDYSSMESYENALFHQLFIDLIDRYPFLPQSDAWYHIFIDTLISNDSVFVAEKYLLQLFDEVFYSEENPSLSSPIMYPNRHADEIRYSSYNADSANRSTTYHKHCSNRFPNDKSEYSDTQYRNDIFQNYPNFYKLLHYASRDDIHMSKKDNTAKSHIMDVFAYAFYLHDLLNLDIEECIQNGLYGISYGIANHFWWQTPGFVWPYWMNDRDECYEEYLKWEIKVNMILGSMEFYDWLGVGLNRKVAKKIVEIIDDIQKLNSWNEYYFCGDIHNPESIELRRYIVEKVKAFIADQGHKEKIPLIEKPEEIDFDSHMVKEDTINTLYALLDKLPDRERQCLKWHYGLGIDRSYTLEEIGFAFGVSRERVRQIEKNAIAALKKTPGFADLCELTNNDAPAGAKHFSFDLPVVKDFKPAKKTRISDLVYLGDFFHKRLERYGVLYTEQLLKQSIEELQMLSPSPFVLHLWYKLVQALLDRGITPSKALLSLIQPYRPPTNLQIKACGFEVKFRQVLYRSGCYTLDALQAMTVDTLKKYRSLTTDDWLKADRRIRELGIIPSEAIMVLSNTSYE